MLFSSDGFLHSSRVFRLLWLRIERGILYNVIRLFRIRTASEKVARGFALGMVINFLPTFGFGVLISGFVARLFGGNVVAGFVGGATLTFFWPLLFYLNIRMGGLFYQPPIDVAEVGDVTEKTMGALVWGKTFTIGAIMNCLVVGMTVYYALRLLYVRVRPRTLAYFRGHAVDHQRRFGRKRRLKPLQ